MKKMPRPTVRGPHPQPLNFIRIRYRFFDSQGYWYNVDNRNTFVPQWFNVDNRQLQFAGVILRDLDGHTWAWYVNDLSDDSFRDSWIWFPNGLYADYFWPDVRPGNIPLPD